MRAIWRYVHWVFALVLLVPLFGLLAPPQPAAAQISAFDDVWGTTDQAVANGQANYSWFWGPENLLQTHEVYDDSPDGQREVRYYDKSRMEINNPSGDRNSIYYVTNGLLTSELITGRLQYSDGGYEQRQPAEVPVAGDEFGNQGTPSYSAFTDYATTDGITNRSTDRTGQDVVEFLNGAGQISNVGANGVELGSWQEVTGHNIASVFWDWANDPDSGFRADQGVNWLYVLGYPITEPYWLDSTVGGQTKRVLVQLFQRRVLTYTAANDDPYKVEYGNIGRHYYRWRYAPPSNASIPPDYSVAFSSSIGADAEIYTVDLFDPGTPDNITDAHAGPDGRPFYSPDGEWIAFYRGSLGDNVTIAIMRPDGSNLRTITSDAGAFLGWSPDSRRIAFERNGVWTIEIESLAEKLISATGLLASFSPAASASELLVALDESTRIVRHNWMSGAETEIAHTADGWVIQDLYWLKGNRYVVLLANLDSGVRCVQVFGISGSSLELAGDCTDVRQISWLSRSPDHTRVSYVVNGTELWVESTSGLTRGKRLNLDVPGSGELVITGLDWTYNPKYLVFTARRGESSALYAISQYGGDQWRLTDPSQGVAVLPSMSPAR